MKNARRNRLSELIALMSEDTLFFSVVATVVLCSGTTILYHFFWHRLTPVLAWAVALWGAAVGLRIGLALHRCSLAKSTEQEKISAIVKSMASASNRRSR